ncbi:sugar transferase, partial [Peptostreptococcus porci]
LIGVPIILIFGMLIKIEDRGPILYKQERLGKHGREFYVYKLRSMRTDAEKFGAQWAEKDDPRITKVGKFIRKTRIDEIPQLINILKGDMGIIGPRPERSVFTKEFEETFPNFVYRLAIKPGLTGWAQVNGGYEIGPGEKLEYDLYYIKNRSVMLDIKIVLMTAKVIFTGDGAR